MILSARESAEARELKYLADCAAKSREARRVRPEEPCPFRTAFQRDRDRIIHSKAFRRLAYKTQVFSHPAGDHYRTRLTHTLEVSQIARTLANALSLNEDLTEAVALGHDLGHTPFGHTGERVLARLHPSGFTHQAQSLRVVDYLEKDGAGLNLTLEVRDGILKHSKGRGPIFAAGGDGPATLEGQIVRISDIIAYLAHDLGDAFRAGLLTPADVPPELRHTFGAKGSTRISAMVGDLLANSRPGEEGGLALAFSPALEKSMNELRDFLFTQVYQHPYLAEDLAVGTRLIEDLYHLFLNDQKLFRSFFPTACRQSTDSPETSVCDFIAGMTDRYALAFHQRLFPC